MAKVTEAARAECIKKQQEYKNAMDVIDEKIIKFEENIRLLEEKKSVAKKLEIAFMCLVAASYRCALNNISQNVLEIKIENSLNEARKLISKSIVLCEDVYGKEADEPLNYNEEKHELLPEELSDKWKYSFICSLGYMIDYLQDSYGDNSKWRWNFVEMEGRFALLAKNVINFKTYLRDLDPSIEGYTERVNLMRLVKKLLPESAEQYRKKYEMTDKRIDDMSFATSLIAALRRIHAFLNEIEESNEQKRVYDLWKKKLNDDIQKDLKK